MADWTDKKVALSFAVRSQKFPKTRMITWKLGVLIQFYMKSKMAYALLPSCYLLGLEFCLAQSDEPPNAAFVIKRR
jgi:hypothetical protein